MGVRMNTMVLYHTIIHDDVLFLAVVLGATRPARKIGERESGTSGSDRSGKLPYISRRDAICSPREIAVLLFASVDHIKGLQLL
eukprot:scaffold10653_cov175-Amphora_coffeaeformis.AAC.5